MTNGSERLDRIERILEGVAKSLEQVNQTLREMAARQQYHDEAFERHDATMKQIGESIAALVRVTRSHHQRLNDIDGGESA